MLDRLSESGEYLPPRRMCPYETATQPERRLIEQCEFVAEKEEKGDGWELAARPE
jgi:hypothetical protein